MSEVVGAAAVGNEILFTKVAGRGQFGRAVGQVDGSGNVSDVVSSQSKPEATRLQLSSEVVKSIEDNVKQYKELLEQKCSLSTEGEFNPWTAVEL